RTGAEANGLRDERPLAGRVERRLQVCALDLGRTRNNPPQGAGARAPDENAVLGVAATDFTQEGGDSPGRLDVDGELEAFRQGVEDVGEGGNRAAAGLDSQPAKDERRR